MLLYEELTYKIRGAIFTVYNILGYGHKEQVYQRALAKEFDKQEIFYKKEVTLDVFYDNEVIGHYRPDFVVDNKIIIELKATEFMPKVFEKQLVNYLKSTKYQLGLLVNFGSSELVIKRLVWSSNDLNLSASNPRESIRRRAV